MHEIYAETKTYLINEIADAMTTLETVAMVAALVPSFLGGED